ncbi:hypothetical protein [Anaerotignum sp. MB30-C6]|uniref:hypothetical protein n=1 Tax=Anaerotignum sp. MB30-C6 TaxID=3070814 RepID=UPI0027DCA83D|nr:hypothetical protein [Anaerotignum sp. MB30-C6]WMI80138.1 hypothetical protein RBQ60_09855 [Anaerotignum sp. MB30-C6]
MKLFELTDSIALSITCARKYNNCAFDGCFYYFTVQCSCEIIKTDCRFYIAECFNTCKEYDCICYDQNDHCFWATTKKQSNVVFKLNCNMCEIDYAIIYGHQDGMGDITGIAYNCCSDSLIISYCNCIIQTNKENGHSLLLYKSNYMQITSILSLCPNLVMSGVKNNEQYIYILDREGIVKYSYPISHENRIKNILFNPCVKNDDRIYLDFFMLKKGCYPYIFRCRLFLDRLPFQPCQCNFNICDECCCTPEELGDACAAILESIALVEAGIALILNCEGEKMQKIINESSDIDVILAANREVNKTIANVSQLEYLLYLKLSALAESGICKDLWQQDDTYGEEVCLDDVNLTLEDCCVRELELEEGQSTVIENFNQETQQTTIEPTEDEDKEEAEDAIELAYEEVVSEKEVEK